MYVVTRSLRRLRTAASLKLVRRRRHRQPSGASPSSSDGGFVEAKKGGTGEATQVAARPEDDLSGDDRRVRTAARSRQRAAPLRRGRCFHSRQPKRALHGGQRDRRVPRDDESNVPPALRNHPLGVRDWPPSEHFAAPASQGEDGGSALPRRRNGSADRSAFKAEAKRLWRARRRAPSSS